MSRHKAYYPSGIRKCSRCGEHFLYQSMGTEEPSFGDPGWAKLLKLCPDCREARLSEEEANG